MRELSVLYGKQFLSPGSAPLTAVALLPPPESSQGSSLGFMVGAFIEEFDGRSSQTLADPPLHRWLADPPFVDVAGLRAAVKVATTRSEPVLLMGTSFAYVHLLEALAGQGIPLPAGSRVMTTGGFKGRSRQVEPGVLRQALSVCFGIGHGQLVAEYGMTELSSQLYAAGGDEQGDGPFVPPPWLRVQALDPVTHVLQPEGVPGVACFTDLANVDSAVRVLTQDVVTLIPTGVVLHGRRPGAVHRGCSLSFETAVG